MTTRHLHNQESTRKSVVSLGSVYKHKPKVDHNEANSPCWSRFTATKGE